MSLFVVPINYATENIPSLRICEGRDQGYSYKKKPKTEPYDYAEVAFGSSIGTTVTSAATSSQHCCTMYCLHPYRILLQDDCQYPPNSAMSSWALKVEKNKNLGLRPKDAAATSLSCRLRRGTILPSKGLSLG